MGGGYVLNFSDRTIEQFFRDDIGVDIFDQKYNYASGSKANRLRGLWRVADDALVGKSIDKLLGYIDNQIVLGTLKKEDFPRELMRRAQNVAARLQGRKVAAPMPADMTEDEFISKEFPAVSIEKLGRDSVVFENSCATESPKPLAISSRFRVEKFRFTPSMLFEKGPGFVVNSSIPPVIQS
jgi:hypothetical protein